MPWAPLSLCIQPGCPARQADPRCPTHARFSSRNHYGTPRQQRGLGAAFDRLKQPVIERDGGRCRLRPAGCTVTGRPLPTTSSRSGGTSDHPCQPPGELRPLQLGARATDTPMPKSAIERHPHHPRPVGPVGGSNPWRGRPRQGPHGSRVHARPSFIKKYRWPPTFAHGRHRAPESGRRAILRSLCKPQSHSRKDEVITDRPNQQPAGWRQRLAAPARGGGWRHPDHGPDRDPDGDRLFLPRSRGRHLCRGEPVEPER